MSKKQIFCVFFGFLFTAGVNAASVSVMVIESGLVGASKANAWENGMMDVFFEAGHIVSNARNLIIPADAESIAYDSFNISSTVKNTPDELIPSEAAGDLLDASENGMDYFLLVTLIYDAETKKIPKSVTLKLFNAAQQKFIRSENYKWSQKATPKADYYNAQRAMRLIIPFMGDQI